MGFSNKTNSISLLHVLVLILLCFYLEFCSCRDTITNAQFISDTETLVSNGTIFKLGFFSPVNTTHRYLGVMYNVPQSTVVWVANRDNPLNDSNGTVTISDDGNLVVLDVDEEVIWSTNVSNSMVNSSAQILDTGNLVLRDNSNGRILWESFENPTDSFLRTMRLSTSVNTDENIMLTSWKSPSDPSVGIFSFGLEPLNIPQIFVWNGSKPYWRSGPWNGQLFIGIPAMVSLYLNGFSLVDDRRGSASISYTYANESVLYYITLNSEGKYIENNWLAEREDWEVTFLAPNDDCEIYGKCGPFGSCYSLNSPICRCLDGFEPNNIEEWRRGNWTSGCVRRTQLRCDRNSSIIEEDGFLELTSMKVPDSAELANVLEDDCRSLCLNSCSCIAYAYCTGIGCMHWSGSLIDIQRFPSGGATLYIRVAYSDLDKKRSMTLIITLTVTIGSIAIAISAYFSWRCMGKRKINMRTKLKSESIPRYAMNQVKLEKLPLFTFAELANATENFHSANKLGQGGFGPVYKGKLPNGQQIAVKRLSRSSGQGLEEFMNEVVVILNSNTVTLLDSLVLV